MIHETTFLTIYIYHFFLVQTVDVTVPRVNVWNFTVNVFGVENIAIHIVSVSIAIIEMSFKIKDKKPLDLHLIGTKMHSRYCTVKLVFELFFNKPVQPKVAKGKSLSSKKGKHLRGCNCKRSGCLKKYCECYQAGVPCYEICNCVGCKNKGDHK